MATNPTHTCCDSPRSTKRDPRRCFAAFSLVELAVVVALITILAGIAVPRYGQFLGRRQIDSAATRIMADIRLTQQYARNRSQSQTIRFQPTQEKYLLLGMLDINDGAKVQAIPLNEPPFEVNIVSANLGGDGDLVFDGFGRPDSGGSITIANGGFQAVITVDALTGEATVP